MDYEKALRSDSAKARSTAACFLRSKRADGYPFVPLLLATCQADNIDAATLSEDDEKLIWYGSLSLGSILNAKGYSDDNALHREIRDWLLSLTQSHHINVAGHAIHAIGEIDHLPLATQHRLAELIESNLRDDEKTITIRATAFQMLSKLNRKLASKYKHTPACVEYLKAVDVWISGADKKPAAIKLLKEETSWLR